MFVRVGILNKLVTNSFISNKSFKIQDGCQSYPLIVTTKLFVLHYQLYFETSNIAINMSKQKSLKLMYLFITNYDVNSANFGIHGLPEANFH